MQEINNNIIAEQNDPIFNDYIENYNPQYKKQFYNIIKDNIYNRFSDRKSNYNNLSKMLYLELLDYTFKHLNEHQQKIYIFNSEFIDKKNFNTQLEDYKNKFNKGSI